MHFIEITPDCSHYSFFFFLPSSLFTSAHHSYFHVRRNHGLAINCTWARFPEEAVLNNWVLFFTTDFKVISIDVNLLHVYLRCESKRPVLGSVLIIQNATHSTSRHFGLPERDFRQLFSDVTFWWRRKEACEMRDELNIATKARIPNYRVTNPSADRTPDAPRWKRSQCTQTSCQE